MFFRQIQSYESKYSIKITIENSNFQLEPRVLEIIYYYYEIEERFTKIPNIINQNKEERYVRLLCAIRMLLMFYNKFTDIHQRKFDAESILYECANTLTSVFDRLNS